LARVFAITLFVSAFLLFWVQPLVAKLLLPYLGGSPTVWNVAMCFFQAALLGGYAWAHWLAGRVSIKVQVFTHVLTLAAAALLLPFQISAAAADEIAGGANPLAWLVANLALLCGLPFVLLAASSPLIQSWFARSGSPRARDPYFLFAASNTGSLLALLAFPFALEPVLRLAEQTRAWAIGYGLLVVLVIVCGIKLLRGTPSNAASDATQPISGKTAKEMEMPLQSQSPASGQSRSQGMSSDFARRLRWVGLSLLPSSLMLGVTQYLTTDVATLPLLWVLPLAIYLVTFIVAFRPGNRRPSVWLPRALPVLTLAVLFTILSGVNDPIWALFPLHLGLLLVAGLVCHGRLAAERPPPERLTEFYFWLSLGGVLGGVFNGLLAPFVFDRVAEYPLALVALALVAPMRASAEESSFRRLLGWAGAAGVGVLLLALVPAVQSLPEARTQLAVWLAFGLPCVAAFFLVDHPRRFALALLSLVSASWLAGDARGTTLARERNFFGVSRVARSADGRFHELWHGSTVHGRQFRDPRHQRMPLSYYHLNGPLKQVFDEFHSRATAPRVAVIGLGAGAMAAYARTNETWTFYEIDPVVVRFARDTSYFTYLHDSAARELEIVTGDARLRLREAPDARFGLIVLDAFSSDSVPVHLLTREAVQLYLAKLAPGGLLAFHVSNRNLNVQMVARTLALNAGLVCVERSEEELGAVEARFGKDAAQWVMAAREPGGLRSRVQPGFWEEYGPMPGLDWSDHHSSLWRVIRW
jgi:spermidine synthase